MKQKELKNLVSQALEKSKQSVEVLSNNDNPQVIELKNRYIGHCQALEAVFDAINNDRVFIRLMGDASN